MRSRYVALMAWVVVSALTFLTAPPVMADSPTDSIKGVIDEVMGILRNPSYQSPAQKPARIQLIEKVATRILDYPEMARLSLGETWDTLDKTRQDEFVRLFSELLKTSYVDRLNELVNARVEYPRETLKRRVSLKGEVNLKGEAAEVSAMILRPNDRIPVRFLMHRGPQGWMIYDIIIEDVSLMGNFNTQFSRMIKMSSYRELLKCLQDKAQENCLR